MPNNLGNPNNANPSEIYTQRMKIRLLLLLTPTVTMYLDTQGALQNVSAIALALFQHTRHMKC